MQIEETNVECEGMIINTHGVEIEVFEIVTFSQRVEKQGAGEVLVSSDSSRKQQQWSAVSGVHSHE